MKTSLITILTAALLGFASIASGRQLDAADFIAILFSCGLVAWTFAQYSHRPRPLHRNRPVRLVSPIRTHSISARVSRQAA